MTSILGVGDRCELPATAVFWLSDDPQPGYVLVEFTDANGRPHQLADKSAIFGSDLYPTSSYPRPAVIDCTIDDVHGDIATVSTRWTTSMDGLPFVFEVRLDVLEPATTA